MNRKVKIVFYTLLGFMSIMIIAVGLFMYKVSYGFNFYETIPPKLIINPIENNVLIFSKTNGFRHGSAIKASLSAFEKMAYDNNWKLSITDNGAVFNSETLQKIDVVIWNNTSGKILNEEQRGHFKNYLETGGGFVGIHAAGDDSHQWEWYEDEVLRARFSHHPLNPQFQKATMSLEDIAPPLAKELPINWDREEEWYMFETNPREQGSNVLYTVDESNINPSGNIPLLASGKDWGMGDDHPIVWYHELKQGRVFYSALGHKGITFQEVNHLQLLENAIQWAGKFN